MIKSIQQFQEKGVKNLEKVFDNYSQDMTKMAEMVWGVRDVVTKLGLELITEELEFYDDYLRKDAKRKEKWYVVRRDESTLLTSLGKICYHKTLFKNRETGEYEYLLDRCMGLEKHVRMTEDAEAKMLEEAVETSYRRGGISSCITEDVVSKQTVKNKIHALNFPEVVKPAAKKVVDYLYIDADEDHVSLQFKEKKGDLPVNERNQKDNCVLAKLVYVYEGIEKEAPESTRHRLVNPHYFSGTYAGTDNEKLWEEVFGYLDSNYDLSKVKKIYLNADGGSWIQYGKKQIQGITTALDEFHLRKYLLKMSRHMKDSAEDVRKRLCQIIKNGTKEEFRELTDVLDGYAETENEHKHLREGMGYILNNWTAAKIRLRDRKSVVGCSAEGHVSHVLSSRMSSRPMGWSYTGIDKMAHLRAYSKNGGDMLELVRYQRREKKAAGAEWMECLSGAKIIQEEHRQAREAGMFDDMPIYSIPYPQIKKIANFRSRIYGL